MSDFEMPRTIGNGTALQGVTRAVEEALAHPPPQSPYARATPTPPSVPYTPAKTPSHSDAIKDRLKQLTHREMRNFVAEIFDAHKKLRTEHAPPMQNASAIEEGNASISMAQLPDVLDKLAYGD